MLYLSVMSDGIFDQFSDDRPRVGISLSAKGVALALLACLLCWSVWIMEGRFDGLTVEDITIAETPVSTYRPDDGVAYPPVVVAHGFGGSRQMMDQISVTLARQGFVVASVDLPGHGRNQTKMSADITRIEGTTTQLANIVSDVADAVSDRADTTGPVSFVGHSMATDVVIRAAQSHDDVGGIVAISMYSTAVTENEPEALLILSGATERRLRDVALDTARLVDAAALEGQTIVAGEVTRRTAVAPLVGHVGVLYAPTALSEIADWLGTTAGAGQAPKLDTTGWVPALLLGSLMGLFWLGIKTLPRRAEALRDHVPLATFWLCMVVPLPVALVPAVLPIFGIGGSAAFGTLAAIFAGWGMVQLMLLRRTGVPLRAPDGIGIAMYLVLGLGVFALALDRYGAAFVPTGDRLWVLLGLLVGTVPLMVADTLLTDRAPLWRRAVARVVLLIVLGAAMALAPTQLGLTFTVLPVLVLFFIVYGSLAAWISSRRGAEAVAVGKGIALAWALAASTPLFATVALP